MAKRTRRHHSPAFKAKVILGAVRGDRTLAQLVEQFNVHPNQIQDWKKKLVARTENLFGMPVADSPNYEQVQQKLHAKIGQLTMENGFFNHCARARPMSERKRMIRAINRSR